MPEGMEKLKVQFWRGQEKKLIDEMMQFAYRSCSAVPCFKRRMKLPAKRSINIPNGDYPQEATLSYPLFLTSNLGNPKRTLRFYRQFES